MFSAVMHTNFGGVVWAKRVPLVASASASHYA